MKKKNSPPVSRALSTEKHNFDLHMFIPFDVVSVPLPNNLSYIKVLLLKYRQIRGHGVARSSGSHGSTFNMLQEFD